MLASMVSVVGFISSGLDLLFKVPLSLIAVSSS
jgi:hypothetical protein